jgi:hypothetical protein
MHETLFFEAALAISCLLEGKKVPLLEASALLVVITDS